MASIKDALEESFQDNHAIIKFVVYTIPLFYCINTYINGNLKNSDMAIIYATYILLFGFMLKCTQNVRNGKNRVLPSLNILSVIWTGIKGLVALGPLMLLSGFAAEYLIEICTKYITDDVLLKIFLWAIGGICASFVFTGCILYAKRFKIADAYNLKLIGKYCIDILIQVFFMDIKLIIIDIIILLPAAYFIWLFFDVAHPVAIFLWSMLTVVNLAMVGHYFAQIDYETIEVGENDDKII